MLKKSEAKLDPKNSSNCFVDCCLRNLSVFKKIGSVLIEQTTDHLHINTGIQRRLGRVTIVRHETMINQLFNRRVVTHNEAIKLPFTTQHFSKGERIRRCRNTVEIIERTHQRSNTSINRRMKGWKVDLAQRLLRHVGRVVVATSLCCSIGDPVLSAR